ncbi:hypothetical protein SCARD494_11605 [Seiridium cardinale]
MAIDMEANNDMEMQLQSDFFGELPREIRDMIYLQFWAVCGSRQHVFEQDGNMTHSPCILQAGEKDTTNEDFEKVWYEQQAKIPGSKLHSAKWARQMSSTWHEHWRCEETMLDAQAQGQEKGILFLSSLLTCKRMYREALPSLYSHTTLILTSLPLSHRFLVYNPSPHTNLLQSLELSLSVPYATLHSQRCTRAANSNIILRHNKWSELCTSLSNSDRFAALRNLVLRLDLEGDDRFWWEVRETWALSALHRSLRPYTTLYLPDLTVDVREKRSFQYASPGEKEVTHLSSITDDPFLMYPLPPHITNPPVHGDSERVDLDFKGLVRYGRRRWTGEGTGDGVQPRLEFFTPRDQGVPNSEASGHKMPGLFWAMLMS